MGILLFFYIIYEALTYNPVNNPNRLSSFYDLFNNFFLKKNGHSNSFFEFLYKEAMFVYFYFVFELAPFVFFFVKNTNKHENLNVFTNIIFKILCYFDKKNNIFNVFGQNLANYSYISKAVNTTKQISDYFANTKANNKHFFHLVTPSP
jgi:hypothetical protein